MSMDSPMKTHLFVALCSAAALGTACAQPATPNASLQACSDATRDYNAIAREGDAAAKAAAERRVLKECYQGTGRAPALQAPIVIGSERKAPAPVMPPPAAPTITLPSRPSVLTACDASGCWDNQGTRYHGSGAVLYGPSGKPCFRNGDWIECR
jgi:hypothetical protein